MRCIDCEQVLYEEPELQWKFHKRQRLHLIMLKKLLTFLIE